MSEEKKKKTTKKKKLITGLIILLVFGALYFLIPRIPHFLWKNSARYQRNVDCLVGRGRCGGYLDKDYVLREMKSLELSKEEMLVMVQLAKTEWREECYYRKEKKRFATKTVCDKAFDYLKKISKILDEISE